MKKRILFVSIAFPPKGDPECIQAGRYFHALSVFPDLSIDVVTSTSPTLFMPVDNSLSKYATVKNQLIELPIYESKYTNFLLRKLIPNTLSKPDSKMTFHWQWKKAVARLSHKPDIIYSRSNPLSSTLMGLKLARHYRVPWVLHLSDPWTENALHSFSQSELKFHSVMERQCFEEASVISFTSNKTLILYQGKYPELAKRMTVFPNVSDSTTTFSPISNSLKNEKLRIVYTGGLANTRTAITILEALHALFVQYPLVSSKLEVIFAGDMDRNNQELFMRYSVPFVKHLGLISSLASAELQQSADLLVVIDSAIKNRDMAVFFPSKLLDYALLQKPIIAITDKESATEAFVVDQGGVCFSHIEVTKLTNWIKSFVDGNVKMQMKPLSDLFSSDYQSRRLVDIFNKLV